MSELSCSEQSLAAGERLAGSAVAGITHWLVIEQRAPWGPKGVEDSGLPEPVVARLAELGARCPALRVQLVREAERAEAGASRLFFARCGEHAGSLSVLSLESLEQLLALPLEDWLAGGPAPGVVESEPLFLVCVHGKRDRCCALKGLPVYRALRSLAGERVLQTTHLGGHRFAATLLVLPLGLCYGRVEAQEADALVAATRASAIHELGRLRGRTCYPSEAQAAEVALRERLGARDALALRLLSSQRNDEHFVVRFGEAESGRAHELTVQRETLPPAPASCGAAPKAGQQLVALKTSAAG